MDLRHPFRFLSSPLEGEILLVLARADKAFTGRELERAIGEGGRGNYVRALRLLTSEGVVIAEKAGRAMLYRLNRDHLAASHIEGLASMGQALLARLGAEIAGWRLAPVAAILFGSAARGEATPESDLDILIIRPASVDPDDDRWRLQILALEERATSWTGNDTRVLEYGEDELPAAPGEEPVIDDALEEGIGLAGVPPRSLRSRISRGAKK